MAWWSSDPPSKTNCLKRKVCRAILSIRARRGVLCGGGGERAARRTMRRQAKSCTVAQTGCVANVIGHVDLLQNAAKKKVTVHLYTQCKIVKEQEKSPTTRLAQLLL